MVNLLHQPPNENGWSKDIPDIVDFTPCWWKRMSKTIWPLNVIFIHRENQVLDFVHFDLHPKDSCKNSIQCGGPSLVGRSSYHHHKGLNYGFSLCFLSHMVEIGNVMVTLIGMGISNAKHSPPHLGISSIPPSKVIFCFIYVSSSSIFWILVNFYPSISHSHITSLAQQIYVLQRPRWYDFVFVTITWSNNLKWSDSVYGKTLNLKTMSLLSCY